MRRLTRDQGGFSLVELVVVIAIMGVVTTVGLVSFGLVTGQNIKSCYRELNSYLQDTRMMALSRQDATLTLYKDASGAVYVHLSTEGDDVRIGKKGLTVKYHTTAGNEVEITGSQRLELGFDRSSGAFKPLTGTEYCDEIRLEDGTRTFTMKLVPKTGKFYRDI